MSEKSQSQLRVSQPVGGEIVSELLNRQDTVLQELDQLNERIEAAIKLINESRQSELDTETNLPQVKAA